jgi:hypothetical protein
LSRWYNAEMKLMLRMINTGCVLRVKVERMIREMTI